MDKPSYPPAYIPSHPAFDAQAAQRKAAVDQAQSQDGQALNFEAALDRIRDRAGARAADADASAQRETVRKADAAQAQSTGTFQASTDEALSGAGEPDASGEQPETQGFGAFGKGNEQWLSDDVVGEAGQVAVESESRLESVEHSDALEVAAMKSTQVSATLEGVVESIGVSSSQMAAGLSDMASMELSSTAQQGGSATTGSNLHGTQSAENVSMLMAKLDWVPGSHEGQWQFGVLNDQAGVTALHLQRNLQGSWRVSVSLDEAALGNEKDQAGELMAALQGRGHSVESVVFSKAFSTLTLVDD